ncbi:glycosyl transferase, partial [Neisseria meningitidis]|nr:glycosyl transferase [Neisseria meningitidis]MBJ7816140.1 glycosyl transferase [Neisseria meningitidis]MCG8960058.1 glycosyl transferase [Neisseria meningitidis]MCG8964153.1 glycosyl transferase [Neisseria meningitidis]MCG8974091.1 glycosyl transferase [Neisseria meningitidis]
KQNSTILNFEGLTMAYSADLRNKALNYSGLTKIRTRRRSRRQYK